MSTHVADGSLSTIFKRSRVVGPGIYVTEGSEETECGACAWGSELRGKKWNHVVEKLSKPKAMTR